MSYDVISSITNNVFIPVLADNVFKSNPLFILLHRKMKKLTGGGKIIQPINLKKSVTAKSYSGADLLDIQFEQLIQSAEFDWCQYAETLVFTGLDDLRNSGPAGVINLIRANVEICEMSMRDKMGADVYGDGTGNNGKNILGLAAAVDDGTNVGTYGTISRTLFTNWKGNYSANAGVGRALTLPLMNSIFELAVIDNSRPDQILTTHGMFVRYLNLLQPNTRYMNTDIYNMGSPTLNYQDRPIVVDDQITSTPLHYMWMLNMRWMQLYVHAERNFRFVNFQQLPQQDAAVGKVLWAGQLVCASPRLQTQARDFDPTLTA